jgi:hypothetical protein
LAWDRRPKRLLKTDDCPLRNCFRGKVTRSWRCCSDRRTAASTLIIAILVILFFVRVNQVLVRLWARHQLSVFSRRLSEISDGRLRRANDWAPSG